MKRILAGVLITICLAAMLSIIVFAAGTTTYELEELKMSIDLSSDYVVFTRDLDENDPNYAAYGLKKKDMSSFMESQFIYLNAWEKDFDHEIVVTMTKNAVNNINTLSDSQLLEVAENIKAEYKDMGITCSKSEIYQHDQAKFIKLHINQPIDGMTVYGVQYYTVYANKAINITLQSYSGIIDPIKESTAKSIVDSAKFLLEPIQFVNEIIYYMTVLILTIVFFPLPISIYRYAIKKNPIKSKKAKRIVAIYSVILFLLNAPYAAAKGGVLTILLIPIWAFVSYYILTKGYKETISLSYSDYNNPSDNGQS